MQSQDMIKMDLYLIWIALAVVVPICATVFGCFFNLKNDLYYLKQDLNEIKTTVKTIQTVLIIKGIMPAELAKSDAKQ